ncbi:MAG: carboxypeptidase-like regulatory domain-containing protein, partial [Patescibacteria group bacterium]|nr:carboxypeptidase-like regulatory domain-containing protein [Patescibacteria group bacterium]
ILYNSAANVLIKWTLGPFLAFFGFALAFMPIEDRPLDQWIINFVKAIYSPTQFLYHPQVKKLDIFEPLKARPASAPLRQNSEGQGQLHEYIESLPASTTSVFDAAEAKYLEHISNLFGALGNKLLPMTPAKPQSAQPIKSSVKGIRVRQLLHPQMCLLPRATVYRAPEESQVAAMPTAKPVVKPVPVKPVAAVKPRLQPAPKPAPKPPSPAIAPRSRATEGPTFVTDIVLPQRPEKPNLIAGITLDKAGKIVPGAILEIRDSQGFPVRALKSNKLGQFFIATPLDDGVYELHAEHADHKFAIIKLEAKNEIIPPLKIQAVS